MVNNTRLKIRVQKKNYTHAARDNVVKVNEFNADVIM